MLVFPIKNLSTLPDISEFIYDKSLVRFIILLYAIVESSI